MTDCNHRAESQSMEPFVFVCIHCGVKMCTDCGSTRAHPDSPSQYCRRCAEKGGHGYAFYTEVDHDKLRAKVGESLAAEIIAECRLSW